MNLQTKLANAHVAYINAKKGERLNTVTVAASHKPEPLTMPFLSVWVPIAPIHPDFTGLPGANFPRLCTVEFLMKSPMKADFEATIALWASELMDILAYGDEEPDPETEDFAMLITALNPGGAQHPADGLYLTNVAIEDESHGRAGDCRLFHLQLSIVAQESDPV